MLPFSDRPDPACLLAFPSYLFLIWTHLDWSNGFEVYSTCSLSDHQIPYYWKSRLEASYYFNSLNSPMGFMSFHTDHECASVELLGFLTSWCLDLSVVTALLKELFSFLSWRIASVESTSTIHTAQHAASICSALPTTQCQGPVPPQSDVKWAGFCECLCS